MWGLDHLGIAKYGQLAADEHPDGWALGAFSRVDGFGDALPAVEKVIKTGRCPRVRLHLMWKDDHKFSSIDFHYIAKEARRVKCLIVKYPHIDWRVSGACEHTLKADKAGELKRIVMREMPTGVTYVNTPWIKGGGALLGNTINEVHGAEARPPKGAHQFSFDGSSCVDSDVTAIKARFSKADTFFFWGPQANGRLTTQDKTPRPQRKAFPTARYIDSWIYLSGDRGAVKLPKNWLIKSHADQHTVPPEPRAGKPVCIIPIKAREIKFTTTAGQVIATASYYGPFSGGGYRYYISDWGYLLAEKAKRISGTPTVEVRVNGKLYGTTNLAFRQGEFR